MAGSLHRSSQSRAAVQQRDGTGVSRLHCNQDTAAEHHLKKDFPGNSTRTCDLSGHEGGQQGQSDEEEDLVCHGDYQGCREQAGGRCVQRLLWMTVGTPAQTL